MRIPLSGLSATSIATGKVEYLHVDSWIGLGILSQAGVAIGLSLIIKHEFSGLGSAHADVIGSSVITTITATCIFFEIIGPILTKIALEKAGEIPSLGDSVDHKL